ncbi:hypothetical protein DM860_008160 [Cuscuta australis]|uniref:Uncharacterized protein n=1 Tax=Cuscuta australis TaxID=267555 RepID=A0A328D4I3_9ASTE|nr:hypothetical protein DM860_008160 [Cuscuta australis]
MGSNVKNQQQCQNWTGLEGHALNLAYNSPSKNHTGRAFSLTFAVLAHGFDAEVACDQPVVAGVDLDVGRRHMRWLGDSGK